MTVFKPSYNMKKTVSKITANCYDQEEKARAIHEWVSRNIEYKPKRISVYRRDAKEIFNDREGICGEQSVLYVTMARLAGIDANWVYVNQTQEGNTVRHACAKVNLGDRSVYVDPTNNEYDTCPKKSKTWDDKEVSDLFSEIRTTNQKKTLAKILIPLMILGGLYLYNEKTNKLNELKRKVSNTLESCLK